MCTWKYCINSIANFISQNYSLYACVVYLLVCEESKAGSLFRGQGVNLLVANDLLDDRELFFL